jgi:RNA polymerase sigma-70 factor (ECF subfamily)
MNGVDALMADVQFEEFYGATRHRVLAFMLAVSDDRGEAQDAVQEAYARAWQRWDRLRSYEDPEAWVRLVAYRLVISAWRRARKRLIAHRRHGPPEPAGPPTPDRITVRAALRRLPDEQRLVVVLHHLLDLSIEDIARQTGAPASTVRTRLVRGRRRLATLIGDDLPEETTHA